MGSFVQNAITDAGDIMLAKVQAGAVFEATRIVMGSGYIPAGKTAETMTDVVAPVVTLSLNKIKASNDGMVTYGGVYSNKEVTADFYFRELALFARVKMPMAALETKFCILTGTSATPPISWRNIPRRN